MKRFIFVMALPLALVAFALSLAATLMLSEAT